MKIFTDRIASSTGLNPSAAAFLLLSLCLFPSNLTAESVSQAEVNLVAGGGLGLEGGQAGMSFDSDLNQCIGVFYKNDPITGDHLILKNNCQVRAHIYFYASPQVLGGETLNPGEESNTYASHDKIRAAGGVSIYACPVGDTPRQADGSIAFNGVNIHFRCSRK